MEPVMDVYKSSIRDLPAAERLLLVERIWDDLAAEGAPLPLPDWAIAEATRRRNELLADPSLGMTHDEIWTRIDESRHG
jgi:putative addiction module component (TIGR02574 family)